MMGVPVKVFLKGRPVFLCCPKCVDRAQADPLKTLDKMDSQRADGARGEGSGR